MVLHKQQLLFRLFFICHVISFIYAFREHLIKTCVQVQGMIDGMFLHENKCTVRRMQEMCLNSLSPEEMVYEI